MNIETEIYAPWERIEREMDKISYFHQKKFKTRPSRKPIRTYSRNPRLLPDGTIIEAYATRRPIEA